MYKTELANRLALIIADDWILANIQPESKRAALAAEIFRILMRSRTAEQLESHLAASMHSSGAVNPARPATVHPRPPEHPNPHYTASGHNRATNVASSDAVISDTMIPDAAISNMATSNRETI